MSESKLIELGYYDPSAKIRLSAYAEVPSRFMRKIVCRLRLSEVSRQ